ncbi:flavodoxin-dependent (E)-4-hydroxy-3-methylbut-2-enyl-diphosphate synthase [Geosporobacter ferrireducens]|uniref:4-hydroxy-3-methylbut-2-en-1-yl diphosphate synthase (flavodoxin) n=1 Tax=Geosporobacter ferrireducens TaxID=1424294 RepID=A0A1D8GBG4_9FIRM|nr:flavodoxin-dependent (E)-4-hydroxy-3-methylbut-2-enyl-diphosphate synthase [Geosporobacter ferrireducens]AOT68241.1 4-hydroxy-3-methylbut-2-en-1-yl diphosphate synthase [Geosporobacter ferrireducens]MTI57339.1 flavodoxin-dependent (E)-4-hydroxy-3-methylbut-2-enyl-diphosphate synthase [Geosporobacter ferrireducens]
MESNLRKKTRKIYCGDLEIGGDAPISIQSMTNTKTADIQSTVAQIKMLEEAGCDIVRVAVPDAESAAAIFEIKKNIKIPLVADIHFDYRLALSCIDNGVDKLRINPGNIGDMDRVKAVVKKAKERKVPIRIGVNSGSIDKKILNKYGKVTAEAMVESALEHIAILEQLDFYDTAISLKASDIPLTVEAYQLMSERVDYPLHVGITEAGTLWSGTIKSSIGIGALLLKGIGDTIRVSLTGDPIEEIRVGKEILQAAGIRSFGIEIISCPTCGRCQIDLISLANKIEKKIKGINKPIKVAIMGCAVNGPGEAREADIGIAGGKSSALLFKKGEVIRKIDEEQIEAVLLEEISKI